ncbi:MAG: hypothetical protein DMG23_02255 [Acidobacteria bacterium]|nr:MAG: hypothetical protein DMG23_02255 [Acidobacteriota bacterium]
MFSSVSLRSRHVLLLLVAGGCLFFFGLGSLPLLEPDEGRNAEVAREMLASGDWVTPHFDSLTYLDKPPVFFWMVAASFRALGVSERSARIPSALMGLSAIFLTWSLARRIVGERAGLGAGIILATSPLAVGLSRLVTFDMTLAFFVTVAMASYWFAEGRELRPAWMDSLMFAAMGVATMTKGPVGFILPLLSMLVYQAMRGRFGDLKRVRWGLGVAVFLAVVLPWFIAISVRHPDFPRYALWNESLVRFAAGHVRRGGSLGYYIPVYLAGFFPWSLFLPFAGWVRLKRWRELRQDAGKPVLFLLVWAGVVLVFFSISHSKLPAYFLPAIVPLSILMAQCWEEVALRGEGGAPDWLTAGLAALLGSGLLLAFAPRFLEHSGALQAGLSRRLHPSVIALAKPSLIYSGLVLVALAVIGRNLARRLKGGTRSAAIFGLLAVTVPLLVVRWAAAIKTYARTASSRQLAETILASPERDSPLYGYYYFRTGMPFYLHRPVGLLTSGGGELTSNYISSHASGLRRTAPIAPSNGGGPSAGQAGAGEPSPEGVNLLLFDPADLRKLSSARPLLVMARNSHVGQLATWAGQIEPLWTQWDCSVWKMETRGPDAGAGREVVR